MKVKCINRTFGFSEYGNFYFADDKGNKYYWLTKSDKAYEEITEGKEIELTSFKDAGKFTMEGVEFIELKNVRFKEA